MSIWTHVTGTIRVDGYSENKAAPFSLSPKMLEYDEDLYNKTEEEREAFYKAQSENWDEIKASGIPMGSEGPLEWEWLPEADDSSMVCGQYVIKGDLRDYEDAAPIIQWIKNVVKKLEENWRIRQGSFHINVGYDTQLAVIIDGYGEVTVIELTDSMKVLYGK